MIWGGIELRVEVGPGVPRQLPPELVEALVSVQVSGTTGKRGGFQVTFRLDKGGTLETLWLPGFELEPFLTRVLIEVRVQGTWHRLMDGVLVKHDLSPSNEPGRSTLTLTGEDLTALMDLIDLTGVPYPYVPTYGRVLAILGKYATYGVIPGVAPDPRMFVDFACTNIQKGTDYAYILKMAEDLGYVFHMDFDRFGNHSVAYLGPELWFTMPSLPALTVNMGVHSNVDELTFSFDGRKKSTHVVWMQESTSKVVFPIPIPTLEGVFGPVFGTKPQAMRRIVQSQGTIDPTRPAELAKKIGGLLLKSQDAVTGSGSLDVMRYGHVLRERSRVGVRGASQTYDGTYVVSSVQHKLKPGESYRQSFTLTRSGRSTGSPNEEVMI
ncbi:MAG: hypothetical protein AAGA48_18965 [Myxococcota bacterium]